MKIDSIFLKEISSITKDDPNLIYRDLQEVCEAFIEDKIVIKVEKNTLVGFIMCIAIAHNMYEIGSLYVKPEYRGNGISKDLINKALKKAEGKNIMVRTSNKWIQEKLLESSFKPVSMKSNLKLAFIYLKDRLESKDKFFSFLKSNNSNSCLFFRGAMNN